MNPFVTFIAGFVGSLLGFLLTAFLVMLVLGGLHHSVAEQVPALGYGASLLVTIAFGVLRSLLGIGSRVAR